MDNPPKCTFEDLLYKLAVFDPEYDMKGKLVGFNDCPEEILMSTVNNIDKYFKCNIKIHGNRILLYLDDYTLELEVSDLEDNIIRQILIEARDNYYKELRGE